MKKFWNFLLGFIAIASFSYAIYQGQFKSNKPKLIFDILSNTEVLSINEDINNLQILFNGDTLDSNKEKLYILIIRIKNVGNNDVKEVDYYTGSPFGFKILKGSIVEIPNIIDASNNFLLDNAKVNSEGNKVELKPIPINENQYLTVKVLVISNSKNIPEVKPIGMVSGIDGDFQVLRTFLDDDAEKEFDNELLRQQIIIFSISAFLMLLIFIIYKLNKFLRKKKRKNKLAKFEIYNKTKINSRHKIYFFTVFIVYGKLVLFFLNGILQNKTERKMLLELYDLRNRGKNIGFIVLEDIDSKNENLKITFKTIDYLIEEGLANISNNDLIINTDILIFLEELSKFSNSKKVNKLS
ncbi:hypothetical protein [Gillisia sp. JM1]|uniref:hypothetical protein n=1 Tax=Gillisia sp. JM1 TaxID=1283286 RepID=UPI00041CC69D|nr:hypothetical protein [Gillisia sp. JM1]